MKKSIIWRIIIIVLVIFSVSVIGIYRLYPKAYQAIVYHYANQYEVDPLLVYAIIRTESRYNANAVSRSGAKGLMQIMDRTGAWGAKQIQMDNYSHDILFKPEVNVQIGCWYISKLLEQYQGDLETALAAYNAGTGNVAKWRSDTRYSSDGQRIDHIPFKETELYVERVLFHYKVYKCLYRD